MAKITSESLPATSEVNGLGLSTTPYLTVLEAETQKTNRIPTVDEVRTVRMYVKQYAWGKHSLEHSPNHYQILTNHGLNHQQTRVNVQVMDYLNEVNHA